MSTLPIMRTSGTDRIPERPVYATPKESKPGDGRCPKCGFYRCDC